MNVIFLDYRGSDNIDDDCEDSSTGMEAEAGDGLLRDENDGAGHEQVSVVDRAGRGQVPVAGGTGREQVPVVGGAGREQVSVVGGAGREQVSVVGCRA